MYLNQFRQKAWYLSMRTKAYSTYTLNDLRPPNKDKNSYKFFQDFGNFKPEHIISSYWITLQLFQIFTTVLLKHWTQGKHMEGDSDKHDE